MRLVDLHPRWMDGFDGREKIGVIFDCPCGCPQDNYVPFKNPIGGGESPHKLGALWTRTGDTFETLSTTPSILRHPFSADPDPKYHCKGWHGFITNGEVTNA
jgi:hypothetical protein